MLKYMMASDIYFRHFHVKDWYNMLSRLYSVMIDLSFWFLGLVLRYKIVSRAPYFNWVINI